MTKGSYASHHSGGTLTDRVHQDERAEIHSSQPGAQKGAAHIVEQKGVLTLIEINASLTEGELIVQDT